MDKKDLLSESLARIMVGYQPLIHALTELHPSAPKTDKLDGSPVTALDLALSELIEQMTLKNYQDSIFYSEEKFSAWGFPLMAIDPLDGTREYLKARPEWALSIGHFPTEQFQGEGWVYNPMTKELFHSENPKSLFKYKTNYQGEVSHSEWEKGFYDKIKSEKFKLRPVGSIAYKLGRLSAGKIDYVVSLAPKNVWDIAGGSLLCQRSRIKFYSQGKEVTKVQKLFLPPLIWCHEELFGELSSLFPPTDKHL